MSEHDDAHHGILPEERSIFETSGFLKALWFVVPGIGAFFCVLNIFLAVQGKTHPHFGWIDGNPVFYGIVGFVSFTFIVLAGQHLRKILMRPEGYYDSPDEEMEPGRIPAPGAGEGEA